MFPLLASTYSQIPEYHQFRLYNMTPNTTVFLVPPFSESCRFLNTPVFRRSQLPRGPVWGRGDLFSQNFFCRIKLLFHGVWQAELRGKEIRLSISSKQ